MMNAEVRTNEFDIPQEVKETYRKFKLSKSKTVNALVLKIDKNEQKVEIDEQLEDTTFEQLQEVLDDANLQPRFILISYPWDRGDYTQYPLASVFYSPPSAHPYDKMVYSRMKNPLLRMLDIPRDFELRELEDLDEEWFVERLEKFY